ncbi:serine/threonine-protein kinase [Haloferula sargassicola]|uniref:Serine/threonine-protein kinase PknD n=1 Tax=Haloferula sargassicola TaxID=490096 RepID=A0ABP9UI97_9BACT
MEERYEIRGKIGQGGLGSVYRAFDRNLNREVALKRIITADDAHQTEEAARQMTQETGALAALQHPNIVTIYDVGTDDDGPFVVMELIKGDTLDLIVEKAPLTQADFLEFALQVQEGMIAAQDLGIVHRDLKPSNVMLNWLPSGKFQVKLVDFGLAKFSPKPSQQTVDHSDSVYGSIFFMAPEQFERGFLDARTDMYAIGCVYYFALAGKSPFTGETGPQVMAAHLDHRVRPLAEVRPDLPQWIIDWVMWHINRQPDDRPENAREALSTFIELEGSKTQMPKPPADPVPIVPKRPRLIIPGAAPEPEPEPAPAPPPPPATQTMPQPLLPPSDSPPSLHTTSHHAAPADLEPAPDAPPPAPVTHPAAPGGAAAATTVPTAPAVAAVVPRPVPRKKKKGLSMAAKSVLAIALTILVAIAAMVVVQKTRSNAVNKRYNELITQAADKSVKSLNVTSSDLDLLLNATRLGTNESRETVYRGLSIARSSDGTDVDARIAEFATTEPLPQDIRGHLLTRVMVARKDASSAIPVLMRAVRKADDPATAAAALKAIAGIGADRQIPEILDVLATTSNDALRRAAENTAAQVIDRSDNRLALAVLIDEALAKAESDDSRRALIRLFGHAGGPRSEGYIKEFLGSGNQFNQLAALEALSDWPDAGMFDPLLEFFSSQTDEKLRSKAFDAAYRFVTADRERPVELRQQLWTKLSDKAITTEEKTSIVRGLAQREPEPWALEIVNQIHQAADQENLDELIDLSGKVADHIRGRIKVKQSQ